MRRRIIATILRREFAETVRNRLLMSTILLPPILLTVAPLLLAGAIGERSLPPDLAAAVVAQRPEWAGFSRVGAGRSLRGPAVPRVLPADAGLHPARDRDLLDHRREAGAQPGAGPGGADPDRRAARRQGDRGAHPGRHGRMGDVHRVRRARIGRLRAEPVRGRDRSELAGRRLRARAGGRAGHRSSPG